MGLEQIHVALLRATCITLIQCFSKWAVEPPGGAERLFGGGHVARGGGGGATAF